MDRFRQPPRIVALFFVEQVDDKSKVVWARTNARDRFDERDILRGIETKAIPQMGFNTRRVKDVVYFTQESIRGLLDGIAVVEKDRDHWNHKQEPDARAPTTAIAASRNGGKTEDARCFSAGSAFDKTKAALNTNINFEGRFNLNSTTNMRSGTGKTNARTGTGVSGAGSRRRHSEPSLSPCQQAPIYAVGVTCPNQGDEVASKNWVYIRPLEALLEKLIQASRKNKKDKTELYSLLDTFYESKLMQLDVSLRHPIRTMRLIFEVMGPLVFEVWKASIARSRILFVDLSQELSLEQMGHFVYATACFSAVPSDIVYLLPTEGIDSSYIRTLYNVCRDDIPTLSKHSHFVASTSDSYLLGGKELYDMAVIIQSDLSAKILVNTKSSDSELRATPRDIWRFNTLARLASPPIIPNAELAWRNMSTAKRAKHRVIQLLSTIISVDMIYGILWWASAGENASYSFEQDCENPPVLDVVGDTTYINEQSQLLASSDTGYGLRGPKSATALQPKVDDLNEPWEVTVVGYIHGMSRRLFQTVSSIVNSQEEINQNPVIFEPPDLFDTGLNPLVGQDYKFITKFVQEWWFRNARVSHGCLDCCCIPFEAV